MVTLAGGVALGSVNPFVYIIIPSYSKDGRITVSGNREQRRRRDGRGEYLVIWFQMGLTLPFASTYFTGMYRRGNSRAGVLTKSLQQLCARVHI